MNSAQPEAKTQGLSAPSSGAHEMVGYDIDLNGGDGKARVTLEIKAKHCNRNGSLHGGIIAMMLDASAGFAASMGHADGGLVPVVTVSLTTNYIAAADLGEQVVTTGTVRGGGKSICYADAEVRNAQGKLIATGNGVFKYIRRRGT